MNPYDMIHDLNDEVNKLTRQLELTKASLSGWESVFGHLGTPDEVGNEWVAMADRLEAAEKERDAMRNKIEAMEKQEPSVPDDVVEQAVNRFLSWKLPKDFHPDGGMVFIPTKGRGYDSPHWPVGTNLFNAQQAREMLHYVLAAAPEAKP